MTRNDIALHSSLSAHGAVWAVVLAGGEGTRLRALTTTAAGVAVPKQFCSLRGGPSLLHEALQRADAIAPRERICAVVARQHAHWWCETLEGLSPANVFVQPRNRGTAVGMLLALSHIVEREPDACVVILPSDHYVDAEDIMSAALQRAVAALGDRQSGILLLGVAPEDPDPELGYIEPRGDGCEDTAAVSRFVEKPTVAEARGLIARGALWNSFIIAARAEALLELFAPRHPSLARRMRSAVRRATYRTEQSALDALYADLPSVDFSRDIAVGQEAALRVLPVPTCGWTDLGTVQRVEKTLAATVPSAFRRSSFVWPGHLSLEQQHRQAHGAALNASR